MTVALGQVTQQQSRIHCSSYSSCVQCFLLLAAGASHCAQVHIACCRVCSYASFQLSHSLPASVLLLQIGQSPPPLDPPLCGDHTGADLGGWLGCLVSPWRGSLFHVIIMHVTSYFDVVLCPSLSQISFSRKPRPHQCVIGLADSRAPLRKWACLKYSMSLPLK